MGNTTVNRPNGLMVTVQTMIDSGYTYREIMDKTGLKSTSHVNYYAKNKHQHRLVVVDVRKGSEKWACNKCHQHFVLATHTTTPQSGSKGDK